MTYLLEGLDASRITHAPDGLTAYSWRGPCRIGGCGRPATDPHHILPRRRTGQPERWILVDGVPVPIVAGLCRRHHDRLHRAESWFEWSDEHWWGYRSPERGLVEVLPLGQVDAVVASGGKHCPHCGRVMPRPNPYQMQRRRRATYELQVPQDAEENGVDILDRLLVEAGEQLGYDTGGGNGAAYHILVAGLANLLQRGDR